MVILYHGTQNVIQYPIHPMGRVLSIEEQVRINRSYEKWMRFKIREGLRLGETKVKRDSDFGMGFYLSESKAFASMRACGVDCSRAYLYEFEINTTAMHRIYEFEKPNLQWVLFLAYNRGIMLYETAPILYSEIEEFVGNYDIIVGPTADDKSYRFIKNFITDIRDDEFTINYTQLQYVLARTALPKQYLLRTTEVCNSIKEKYCHTFEGEELKTVYNLARARSNNTEKESRKLAHGARTMSGYSFLGILRAIEEYGYSFQDLPESIPYEEGIEADALEQYELREEGFKGLEELIVKEREDNNEDISR